MMPAATAFRIPESGLVMIQPRIHANRDPAAWMSLLVLPACFVGAALAARTAGGPPWLSFNLDPDYFYLLDALNIVNLTTPGHVFHPGATVHWLGALVLKAAHPLSNAAAITDAVLADPVRHLRLISDAFVAANGVAAAILGIAAWLAFGALAPAWLLQTAPLLSMVTVKHSHHVKPEALLVATTLALMAVAVTTLRPGELDRHGRRFAVAFGVIAGFGAATKVTALPIFVLPLFVLAFGPGGGRAVAAYVGSAAVATVVFTLPMAGAYDVFLAWIAHVGSGSGAYGGGAPGVVDWGAYPRAVAKLVSRPVTHVPLAAALATLAWADWRRRRGLPLPAPETRLLAGVAAAEIAQVLLIAKQPNAMYLIPSLMLGALAFVVAWRLWSVAAAGDARVAAILDRGPAVLLAVLLVAQGAAVVRLVGGLADDRAHALAAADDSRFARCARVYSYAASSPAYALQLADYVTGSRFAGRLAERGAAGIYWLEHWWSQDRVVFRDWRGPADIAAVVGRAPCVVFRGSHWQVTEPLLMKLMPGLAIDARCRNGEETTATRGVGCDGNPLPAPPGKR